MSARTFAAALVTIWALSVTAMAQAQSRPQDKPSPKAVPALTATERAAVRAQLGLRVSGDVAGVYVAAGADGHMHRRHKRDGEDGCEHIEQDASGTVRLHTIVEGGVLTVRRWDATGTLTAREEYLPDGTPHGRHWRREPIEPGGEPVEVVETWERGVKL